MKIGRANKFAFFITIDLDVGLNHFYTDSKGEAVENPRFLRKSANVSLKNCSVKFLSAKKVQLNNPS